jgi:H+/Cl- antiporter ClcA
MSTGVFFVIEEAISFFDAQLVFRTYFTCIVAYYFLEIMYDGHVLDTDAFTPYEIQVECRVRQVWDVWGFWLIAEYLCGL